MSDCPICTHGYPLDVLAEFPTTWVTGGTEAPLPGYVCVVAKHHVAEPFELSQAERVAFWEDSMRAARALTRLFNPRKINYEIHGNTIPHLHMHIYPRYAGDPYEGRPISGEARFQRTPDDLERIRESIQESSGSI